MRSSPKFGSKRGQRLLAVNLIALLAVCGFVAYLFSARSRSAVVLPKSHRMDHVRSMPGSVLSVSSAPDRALEIRRYNMDLSGDHTLELATVIEQGFTGYAKYTLQFRFASGAVQSVDVAAPPGGLQLEMRDMTGDDIPNDLLVRPAFFGRLPTVLVNNGHDHFAVAISGADLSSFSSGNTMDSRDHEAQHFAFLASSSFKIVHLVNRGGLPPRFQADPLFSFYPVSAKLLAHTSRSERAPPAV